MRSAAVAVLAALASIGSASGAPEVASDLGSRLPPRATVLAYVWDGRPLLVRVDAVTLRARSRTVDLGKPPISTWVRSPGGERLVLGSGDRARLTLVDLDPKGYVAGLAWPTPRRVVAALSGMRTEIVVVDAITRRVVRRHRLAGTVTQAARSPGGLVLLLSPHDRVGRATLAVATRTQLRTAMLPLEAGTDPPAVFGPGLAVSGDGRHALVVVGGARALEVDLRTLVVAERHLSEPVSLLGRLRAWLEPAAVAKGPLEGPIRSAAWIGRDRVVVAGSNYRPTGERSTVSEAAGARLIDVRDWSVRTLAGGASTAVATGDTVLAFGGTQGPAGLRGIGLRGFGRDGRER
jgi:hypothetical protein